MRLTEKDEVKFLHVFNQIPKLSPEIVRAKKISNAHVGVRFSLMSSAKHHSYTNTHSSPSLYK